MDPGCVNFMMSMLQADPVERYSVEQVLDDPWLNTQLDLLHHCYEKATDPTPSPLLPRNFVLSPDFRLVRRKRTPASSKSPSAQLWNAAT